MADDGYTSSNTTIWEDHSTDLHNSTTQGRPSFQSLESVDENSSVHGLSISPKTRSSSDSAGKSASSQPWRDNNGPAFIDRRDTISTIHTGTPSLVEPSFDENVLRALCELDVSFIPFVLPCRSCTISHCPPRLSSVECLCFSIE